MTTYSLIIPGLKPISVELFIDKLLNPELEKLVIRQGSKSIIIKDRVTLIALSKSLKSVRKILRDEK